MTTLRHLHSLARAQHWVLDLDDLRSLGLTRAAIRHRVDTGVLYRVHTGVYAVGRRELTREGRWMAAVLACGRDALLSHPPAVLLWRLVDRLDERPHVTVPRDHRLRRPGITVHASLTLTDGDRRVRQGIPVTSLQRTLVDVARTADGRLLRTAVRQAERLHRLDLLALHARVATPRTDVGAARLHALLEGLVPAPLTESELEARFIELCARHRLPAPVVQVPIAGYRADFAWPHARLIVETDGRETHDTHVAFLEDRVKDRALTAAGWVVLRFTWAEVVHQAAQVAREIRAALRGAGA